MRIWSQDTKPAKDLIAKVPFSLNGQLLDVEKKITAGEMEYFSLSKPIGEMLTSEASRKELLQKVVLDVEMGKETVANLYSPIYDTIADPNLPRTLDAQWEQYGAVYFTEHLEGDEVKFGSLQAEKGPITTIVGYAAGFEYTKEMVIFNQTWSLELLNKALGEAHVALKNNLHLSPFINATYASGNKTAFQGETTDPTWVRINKTLRQAVADTAKAKRPGTILLAAGANKPAIEEALRGGQVGGTIIPPVSGITDIIYYDGWSVTVGKKAYTYDGITEGLCYLIRPKRGFKSLQKQDLMVQATMGDLTTLTESQIVADFWHGVYAAVGNNAQEVTIAAS
jgi:hypothetical protein